MTPSAQPIKLTFYNPEDGEIEHEYATCIIPWGILKRAMRFAKRFGSGAGNLDIADLTDADIDEISGLVVDLFGDRFTMQDLANKTELTEVITVMQQIFTRAGANITNFTKPKG
jgi:hypothetical protein